MEIALVLNKALQGQYVRTSQDTKTVKRMNTRFRMDRTW
jgi:hypothetical protein